MAQIIDSISYLTAQEAAQQIRTTPTRILMLLKGEALGGVQIDGEWFVSSDSVACFKANGNDLKTAQECVSYCSASGCSCK